MPLFKCDILVVGAGPAGSSAALAAARKGMQVLMVERKAKAGVPVRCAEYMPAPLLGKIGPERNFVVQRIRGMRTFLPDGETKEMIAPGYTIRRDLFDQALARTAGEAGVKILFSTRILAENTDCPVLKLSNGSLAQVETKAIIGADGPHSTVAGWMDAANRSLIPAVQARVPLVNPVNFTEVYLKKDLYGGYGWLFPKKNEANVGLGVIKRRGESYSLRGLLEQFLFELEDAGKIIAQPLKYFAGWIPAGPVKSTVVGNKMLVGDAAGQTHPITGAGLPQAVICGRMAGKWAARAVTEKNLDLLKEYEREWKDLFGESLVRARERRTLMEQEWERFDTIIKRCWIAFREYYSD
jgi:digeranylgeranylglycerophospholipid reductase